MSPMLTVTLILLAIVSLVYGQSTAFRYANTLGDNMVLQQQPYKSQIWGFCDVHSTISLQLIEMTTTEMVQQQNTTTGSDSIWLIPLDPMPASFSNYSIITRCSSSNHSIAMHNVLFGDVFLCSGQSNMQFTVDQAFNATQNTAEANDYPFIRVFTAENGMVSNSPQNELAHILEPWRLASNKSIGCGNWSCFSAVCWFTALSLYPRLNYPLGLISSVKSGSPIRCWLPDEAAAAQCNENITLNNYSPAICWNALIAPFLRTSIKAVLWYQGEQDTKIEPLDYEYSCAFPLMINLWRSYFHQHSDTDLLMPFGYVQLSVFLDSTQNVTCGNNESASCLGAALVRWGQSANYSYLPNQAMVNTFFATAIDLGDPDTPYVAPLGPVHPRYKKPAGDRLADAAMNVVYGDSSTYFGGPYAQKAMFNHTKAAKGYDVVTVVFRNVGEDGIWIKHNAGFELYDEQIAWFDAFEQIEENGDFAIDVAVPRNVSYSNITQIRYNFYDAPCLPFDGIENCAIYDRQWQLPAIPFLLRVAS